MARLIVEQILSADGFAAAPDGSLDFFESVPGLDQADPGQLEMLQSVDAILLGRTTYTMFESYWPTVTADEELVAEPINRLPKHVISNTLRRAPWGDYSSATVEQGEPRDTVRRLKQHYAGDIIVWGSLQLAGALLQAELVDRVRLRIVPVLIGEGITATPGLRHSRSMHLRDVQTLPTGHVTLDYEVL